MGIDWADISRLCTYMIVLVCLKLLPIQTDQHPCLSVVKLYEIIVKDSYWVSL